MSRIFIADKPTLDKVAESVGVSDTGSLHARMGALNSDLNEPLNYLMWINDLATFGTRGYAFKNIDILTELSAKSSNARNNELVIGMLLSGFIQNNSHVGVFFKQVIPSNDPVFDSLATMDAVAASTTAMNIVAASTTAMNAVAVSTTAMNIVIASTTAMNIVIASTTAMNAVAASTTAMNIVVASTTTMNAVVASTTAMTAVFNSAVARGIMWDSASASDILMTTGRAWMVANRQLEFTRGNINTWVSANIPGKIFVLERHTSHHFNSIDDWGDYRTLATGGAVGGFRSRGGWQDRSDRINNLEVWKPVAHTSATISLRYVLM